MPDNSVDVKRFSPAVRAVHWSVTVLMVVCVLSAFALYNPAAGLGVGHRHLVVLVHVGAGFALPVPVLLGLFSPAFRQDLRRLNRFSPSDWRWLRSRTRRDGRIRIGKFNAGQKLNTALSGGAIVVLLATGTLMYFTGLARLSFRSGSTFVHDWVALGLGVLVVSHVLFALRDPEARRGMRTGRVTRRWAEREHAVWAAEQRHNVTDAVDDRSV